MQTTLDIAALAKVVLWPLLLVVLLAYYRSALVDMARALGPRIRSLKLGEFSVELAEAKELRPPDWGSGGWDLRNAGQASWVNSSAQPTLLEWIQEKGHLDYAVVDLGSGQSWLSSRLFILAAILRRMRGLKALVFVETTESSSRRYIGVAECDKVRWRLAARYPWLEYALSRSWADPDMEHGRVVDDEGRMEEGNYPGRTVAEPLLRAFLTRLQTPPTPADQADQWVALQKGPGTYERATWLTRSLLEDVLGEALDPMHLRLEDLDPLSNSDRARAVIRRSGRFVAVTRDERVFHRLVDRWSLVESIMNEAARLGDER